MLFAEIGAVLEERGLLMRQGTIVDATIIAAPPGIFGIYHSVSEEHLKRYLCEFDFRYNYRAALCYSDMECTEIAAAGIYGKRLTYRRPDNRANV